MKKILISWVGMRLDEARGNRTVNLADLAAVVTWREIRFDIFVMVYDENYPGVEHELEQLPPPQGEKRIVIPVKLADPNDHEEIFAICTSVLDKTFEKYSEYDRYFYITPGTATMHAVWVFLAKTRYAPTKLVHAPRSMSPRVIDIPFEISIDFVPGIFHRTDRELLALEPDPDSSPASFRKIIARSKQMKEVLGMATILAKRSIPVLLEGESGTGKSLLARAIHDEGNRKGKAFIQLNCGGLTESLVESELFGIEQNVATGVAKRTGVFEMANGGTLFLDEIGELPPSLQTRLLLVLDSGEVTRVGGVRSIKVDVRIIAATNKNLINEVQEKRFREDLFYRLAGAAVTLPNLISRQGDLTPLIDGLLDRINREEIAQTPSFSPRTLSAEARNKLLLHHWPGNVRELDFTLRRAVLVFSGGPVISPRDIEKSLLPSTRPARVTHDVDACATLDNAIRETVVSRISAAWETSMHNQTRAAKMLGISRPRFLRIIEKYEINLDLTG